MNRHCKVTIEKGKPVADCPHCAKSCALDRKYKSEADGEWYLTVKDMARALSRRLGIPAADLAQCLGYWRKHYPVAEREDALQELAAGLLAAGVTTGALAWTVCRRRTADWWRAYKAHRLFYQVESESVDGNGNRLDLAELAADVVDYRSRLESAAVASQVLAQMPAGIRALALKKARGERIGGGGAQLLAKWASKNPVGLVM